MPKPHDNCHCLKCGNSWFSQMLFFGGARPKTCPKCHRYDWMEPRIRKHRQKK